MKRSEAIINDEFKKFITKERKGKIFEYTDTRTKIIDGVPHIYPTEVDQIHVYIVCPFCKSFHMHGSCDDTNYSGGRVSHCLDSEDRRNYYIEKI